MNNNVDTRLQRTPGQASAKSAKSGSASGKGQDVQNKPQISLNRTATTQYLSIISHEQDEVGDALSRSINRMRQSLSHTASRSDQANTSALSDEQAERMGVYSKLAAKLINRDQVLQERVAQNLSTNKKLVRSRDAADTLQQSMNNLPRALKEGTPAGKDLAKFMVENLVSLSDTRNMGAGLERDLAVRQIAIPKHQPNLRMQMANNKILAASIAYIQSNQPEILKELQQAAEAEASASASAAQSPKQLPPDSTGTGVGSSSDSTAPGSSSARSESAELTTAQVMTRYLQSALNEFPEDSTYLDIFKQNKGHIKSEGYADKMSEEIARRIHNLISQAAATARSGNLIKLSPEEAENFDRTVTQARQAHAAETAESKDPLNNPRSVNQIFTRTSGSDSDADDQLPPAGRSQPDESVRNLSLSELSARAAKLQQQFRSERQRLAQEGKLPNPAPMPESSFTEDNQSAEEILKNTLSPTRPETYIRSEREQALARVEANTRALNAALEKAQASIASKIAQAQSEDSAAKNTQSQSPTLSSGTGTTVRTGTATAAPTAAATVQSIQTAPGGTGNTGQSTINQAPAQTPAPAQTTIQPQTAPATAAQASDATTTLINTADGNSAENIPASPAQTTVSGKAEAASRPESAAAQTPAISNHAHTTIEQDLLSNTSLNLSYRAVQTSMYGGLDIMPGMTIPVSHFGNLDNEIIQPNDEAINALKQQARILEEQQSRQQQSALNAINKTLTEEAAAPAQEPAATRLINQVAEDTDQVPAQNQQAPTKTAPADPETQVKAETAPANAAKEPVTTRLMNQVADDADQTPIQNQQAHAKAENVIQTAPADPEAQIKAETAQANAAKEPVTTRLMNQVAEDADHTSVQNQQALAKAAAPTQTVPADPESQVKAETAQVNAAKEPVTTRLMNQVAEDADQTPVQNQQAPTKTAPTEPDTQVKAETAPANAAKEPVTTRLMNQVAEDAEQAPVQNQQTPAHAASPAQTVPTAHDVQVKVETTPAAKEPITTRLMNQVAEDVELAPVQNQQAPTKAAPAAQTVPADPESQAKAETTQANKEPITTRLMNQVTNQAETAAQTAPAAPEAQIKAETAPADAAQEPVTTRLMNQVAEDTDQASVSTQQAQAQVPVPAQAQQQAAVPNEEAPYQVSHKNSMYARLYGQMQTGNYDEAQIKHPTTTTSDSSAHTGNTGTVYNRNAGDESALPDMPGNALLNKEATFRADARDAARNAERTRDETPVTEPVPKTAHASTTDTSVNKEYLSERHAEIKQEQAQQREIAVAKALQEQKVVEQSQRQKQAAESIALERMVKEQQEQNQIQQQVQAEAAAVAAAVAADTAAAAAAAVPAPQSVPAAPSILMGHGSSVTNPLPNTNNAGTANELNRLYREAMQQQQVQNREEYVTNRQQQTQQSLQAVDDAIIQQYEEENTLTRQNTRQAQILGSSQINTIGDTNIRATGTTVASTTTAMTHNDQSVAQQNVIRHQGTVGNTRVEAQTAAAGTSSTVLQTEARAAAPQAQSTMMSAPGTGAAGMTAGAGSVGTGTAGVAMMAPGQNNGNAFNNQNLVVNGVAGAAAIGAGSQAVKPGQAGQPGMSAEMMAGVGDPLQAQFNGQNQTLPADAPMLMARGNGVNISGTTASNPNAANAVAAAVMGLLGEDTLQDEIIKNVMQTVPSDDMSEFALRSSQALSGVVADTELIPDAPVLKNNVPVSGAAVVPTDSTPGAAAITAGQNAPIPEESVIPPVFTPKEGGLFRRLASLFGRKNEESAATIPDAEMRTGSDAETARSLQAADNQTAVLKTMQEQSRQTALRQSSLDHMINRLQTAAGDQALPPKVQEQAQKLLKALQDPVADLQTVSSWLNFVTGPLSPSSSQALALHQWAFMLLCFRFEQIGKNADKFLKKHLDTDSFQEIEPVLQGNRQLSEEMDNEAHSHTHRLLDETLNQVEHLQQQQSLSVTPPGQAMPGYIPLPPGYTGGREGSLTARQQTDEDGGKSWMLNFNLDLENMGAMQVKVKLRFPEVQMSFIVERFETLQKVQSLMPTLNAQFKRIGLTATGSNARLGHIVSEPVAPESDLTGSSTGSYEGSSFNADA